MRSPYFEIRVHKFPKVPRQYFVTPVFDNQKLYDPPRNCNHLHTIIFSVGPTCTIYNTQSDLVVCVLQPLATCDQ